VESVRDERRLRAKPECVFGTCRACHSGLPTLTTLVLLCLPVDRFLSRCAGEKQKTPTGQTEAKTMEYQSNSNSASTASNGPASSIASNTASGSENRKPISAQQLVRENVQYLIEQLEAGHSEALTAFLRAMAVFREYSFGNQTAIARQRPSATRVAGMYAWNQLGRFVNKGEKGIAILAPVIGQRSQHTQDTNAEQSDAHQSALLGFRRVYVWAEDQTHGLALPELEQVTGEASVYLDRMREFVHAQGITLEYTESISPALGMAFGTTIRILPGQSKAEELTTLVHETAHLALKHQARRTATTKTVRETEAEAVAFVVAQGIGINAANSASYIQLYHGNAALLMESLELVQQTAAVILAAIQPEEPVSQEAA
jgi:N-terminal domain of anti-restriction factor ArdC